VPLLAPKAQSTSGVALTLPAGTYYVIAVVDATGRVAEALETNNVKGIKKVVP
jgi:subtilase family serine protease